jgi:hypothetical protein
MEEHRRLEGWRKEQAAQAEKATQLAEQIRRREEEERKKKIQLASSRIKGTKADLDLVTGWVTMQTGDSLVWRRRYFKFIGSTVFFYRSPKEKVCGAVLYALVLIGTTGFKSSPRPARSAGAGARAARMERGLRGPQGHPLFVCRGIQGRTGAVVDVFRLGGGEGVSCMLLVLRWVLIRG